MSATGMTIGHEASGSGCETSTHEGIFMWDLLSTGLDIAEIEITMSLKNVDERLLEKLLEANCAQSLEELDVLALRNFLHYLRSL